MSHGADTIIFSLSGLMFRSELVAQSVFSRSWLVALALLLPSSLALAAHPADQLLPWLTKGYVSSPNLKELQQRFDDSALGELVQDEAMKPFVEDMKRQIKERLSRAGVKLGIQLEDLQGIASGEVAIAAIQPNPVDKNSHAQVLMVDVTGNDAKLKELLATIEEHQTGKGAKKSTRNSQGVEMTLFVFPQRPDQTTADYAVYFIKENQLVVSDHLGVADDIAARFGNVGNQSLSWMPAYRYIMKHEAELAGSVTPQVKWYIEPFGFAEVSRAMNGGRKKRGTDMLKILAGQGFTAVQGIGGYVFLKTADEELLHRTFIYAPPVARAKDSPIKDKYDLATRMLNFPNNDQLQPQDWVPIHVANYLSFNWKMQDAFKYCGSLVDAIAGEKGVFDEVILSLHKDPNGPQIDIRKGLVQELKERATFITDYRMPIDTKSERWLVAIEVNDAAVVAETVKKAFENDPSAKRRIIADHVIWEIIQEEDLHDAPTLTVEGPGFVATEEEPIVEEESKPVLPNSAITVAKGHLIVSSHVDFVEILLKKPASEGNLSELEDFQRVKANLERLGAGDDSFRYFAKTDESYRPTYELIRQGKMPEAETLLAKLLNVIMAPPEEGDVRSQQIDGSKLPDYEAVRKYFGPTGMYVRSVDDGWEVIGSLLKSGELSKEK